MILLIDGSSTMITTREVPHRWAKIDPLDRDGIDRCGCGAERKYAGPSRFGRGVGSTYVYRANSARPWGATKPAHKEGPTR